MTETNELKGAGTLTLGGKDYTYKLDNNALRLMCKAQGKTLTEVTRMMSTDAMNAMPLFIFCGVQNYMARSGAKFKMEFDQFCALFGDIWDDEVQLAAINTAISNAWSLEDVETDDESEQKAAVEIAET